MADLSRERIAKLRDLSTRFKFGEWELDPDEFRSLLSMAERAVSEETVRKLYVAQMDPRQFTAFHVAAVADLRPSAARLAAKGAG